MLGCLNLLIGNEGVGKGVLIAWMFARLTRGELPGDLHGQPCNVGLIADEDSFDGVWTPRLHAAGADFDHIFHIERQDGWTIDLSDDYARLRSVAQIEGLQLIFMDALLDNLGVGLDDWRTKRVRDALQPLRVIAREHDLAVFGSLHPNKRAVTFRQLVSGAAAFNAVSRSSLLLAEHPNDETRRALVRGKGNLSSLPKSVEFGISSYQFAANGYDFNVPLATDFSIGDVTVAELIEATNKPSPSHTGIGQAIEIIEATIPNDGEWHLAKLAYDACAAEDIENHTVLRAAKRLKLEQGRSREYQAPAIWRWPPQTTSQPTPAP